MEQPISFLDKTALFGKLLPQHKEAIAKHFRSEDVAKGTVFIKEGETAAALYILAKGEAVVFARDPDFGVEFELNRLKEGAVIGEIALILGEKRTASVRAVTDVQLLALDAAIVSKVMTQLPQITLDLAKGLANRVNELTRAQGFSYYDPRRTPFDPNLIELVPPELIDRHQIIPIAIEGDLLTLAMVDPRNCIGIDDFKRCIFGKRVTTVAITENDFKEFLTLARKQAKAVMRKGKEDIATFQIVYHSGQNEPAKAPAASTHNIPQILDRIIGLAVDKQASDIHIEVNRDTVVVKYRVEGGLQRQNPDQPIAIAPGLISRIKLLAGLDINERRVPQDGRISLTIDERETDLRVSTLPSRYGEKVVMRILDASSSRVKLDQLILGDTACNIARRMIFAPHGLVLVTGPTGSGKSTTLFSSIYERISKDESINILTAEDPIEYSLPGITQVEVNLKTGLTYPRILRSFMRQDPDVILIGEMRDAETAGIAAEAALTGHLVLSTLHTNSAVESVSRLFDLGLQPFQIADGLNGIISQRLVRRVCAKCSAEEDISFGQLEELRSCGIMNADDQFKARSGKGCPVCRGSGFQGRIGVYELFWMTDALRQLIFDRGAASAIREEGLKSGLVPLERYSRYLLEKGLTTPAELLYLFRLDAGRQ